MTGKIPPPFSDPDFREAAVATFRWLGYGEPFLTGVRLLMEGAIPREAFTAAQLATIDRCFEMLEPLTARLLHRYH